MACDSCHKFPSENWKEARRTSDAFPDVTEYPEHASCINCHRAQFFARERPAPRICSVCHTNVTPRNTTRHPFPSLGETFRASTKGRDYASEFRVGFPHDKHLEVVSALNSRPSSAASLFLRASFSRASLARSTQESDPKNCAVCHQTYQPQGKSADEYVTKPPANLGDAFWLKKGTFKTVPDTHAACFNCHSTDTGIAPAPSDCAACHKLPAPSQARADFDPAHPSVAALTDMRMLAIWRARDSSATFRHEGGAHPELSCTTCHNVSAMNTTEAKTLRVPVLTCGGTGVGCHVTASADEGGILNFEVEERRTKPSFQCAKCHLVYGREALPKSHADALVKASATETK